jgi:tRNA-modifying protein YgfZ
MATHAPPELDTHYRAMREGCALFEPERGATLRLYGPDAVEFLQGQVTNDVSALEPHSGCYALLLNPKGRILAELRVLMVGAEELLLLTEQDETVRSNLNMFRIGRQVEIEEAGMRTVHLFGPGCGQAVGLEPPPAEHAFAQGEIDGVPALAVRTDVGMDVLFPHERAHLVDVLRARATGPVHEDAAEILRVETGRPRYGADMTVDNLPGELGLEERAVSFTKGCYVGQEPVARMHHRGHPNRHLRGLRLSAPAVSGQELRQNDKQVGTITSACLSPALGPIALALVRREVEPGSSVELDGHGRSALVVELPFELDDR